jgi:3-demethoxyubiquinol 3-hydroxylase
VSGRGTRPKPPGVSAADESAAMIRVDQAGEYGAVRIYEGQLAVLGKSASKAADAIRAMAGQEQEHLQRFDALVRARGVKTTVLEPFWHLAGYALGAATALAGEKTAMACTEAVEEVIDRHYSSQIEKLGERDPALRETIEKCRADEIAHRDAARAHGAGDAPGHALLCAVVKLGCRVAIALSTRI